MPKPVSWRLVSEVGMWIQDSAHYEPDGECADYFFVPMYPDNVVNGRPYNLSRVDFALELGSVVEWTLQSAEAPRVGYKALQNSQFWIRSSLSLDLVSGRGTLYLSLGRNLGSWASRGSQSQVF